MCPCPGRELQGTTSSARVLWGMNGRDRRAGGTQMLKKATFGAGCFWGVEDAFRKVPGVTDTAVGYSGGTTDNPTYRQVCSHKTGHAEVTEVAYDPEKVSYEELLDVFWNVHDP